MKNTYQEQCKICIPLVLWWVMSFTYALQCQYSEIWLQVPRIKTAYFNQTGKLCKFTFHPCFSADFNPEMDLLTFSFHWQTKTVSSAY